MKIIRAQNPVAIDYLVGKLILDAGESEELELEGLKNALRNVPDKMFILMAFEGSDLLAFVISSDVDNSDYVFIHQAWCASEADQNLVDKMFYRLLLWTDSVNKNSIRAETKRGDAIISRWNFIEHSKIVRFDLPEVFESDLLQHRRLVGKEDKDVKRVESKGKNSIEIQSPSAEHREPDVSSN